MKTSRIRGFTLIELLVVIAIIGILATVVIASLNNARTKARDTGRVQELKQIQIGLELYYSKYGSYPKSQLPSSGFLPIVWPNECQTGASVFPIPELIAEGFFAGVKDPVVDCSSHHWGFSYASDGKNYKLISHTEDSLPKLQNFIDPAQDYGPDICVLDGSYINDYTDEWGTYAREHFGLWTDGARCWLENSCDPNDATRPCSVDPDGDQGTGTNH